MNLRPMVYQAYAVCQEPEEKRLEDHKQGEVGKKNEDASMEVSIKCEDLYFSC